MKRTRNMVYVRSEEARELLLCATNDSRVYPQICQVVRALAKKHQKGTFDADKAIDAFYAVATAESELYERDFGYRFTVTQRFTAAAGMVAYYMENIEKNDL